MRFEYELALALGKFLYELDAAPAEEIIRWRVYAKHYLFGERRADLRNGMQMAQQSRIWGRKGCQPKPLDYMPYSGDFRGKGEDWRESYRRIMALAKRQQERFDACRPRQRLG